jgi:hypothetical protein
MENRTRKGSDWIGPLARGVLADCKRAMEARKQVSGDLDGPKNKKPEAAPERQHTSGSPPATWEELGRDHTAETGRSGLRIGGGPLDLGCNSFSFEASEDANGPDAGSIPSTDRGECEHSLPYVFSEFYLRAVPRRAWLGGANVPVSPSSRLLIGCNDNRRHAALDCSISSRVARRESVSIAQYTMP